MQCNVPIGMYSPTYLLHYDRKNVDEYIPIGTFLTYLIFSLALRRVLFIIVIVYVVSLPVTVGLTEHNMCAGKIGNVVFFNNLSVFTF